MLGKKLRMTAARAAVICVAILCVGTLGFMPVQATTGADGGTADLPAEDLYVNTVLSKDEAFLGEKVVLTYELFSRYNLESYGFSDYNGIDGVIAKDVPQDQLRSELVSVDGVTYAWYETRQFILDPIRPGVYEIPSFTLRVNIVTETRSGAGGFSSLFRSSEPRDLQTDARELAVNSLPTAGRPDGFSGIVGQLQLNGTYSREEVEYGDSLVFELTASGSCNLDGFTDIFGGGLPGFTVYETLKNSAESVESGQYRARKEFEAILVPEQTGALDIAPISISYFDPATGRYETAEVPGTEINVLGDMPMQTPGGSLGAAGAAETVRVSQVNYTDTDDEYISLRIRRDVLAGVLIGAAALVVFAFFFMRYLAKRKNRDDTMESLYKKLLASDDVGEAYNLFNSMVKYRYGLSLKASSQSAIRDSLLDTATAEKVIGIMEYMESAEARGEGGCAGLKERARGVTL
ncbi:MAG: BatD family protein [Clostridiales bacterium]|nr:BatD family protein [Clostridiales bacterium]